MTQEHEYCAQHHILMEVKNNTDKMIEGLYGPLNNPQQGFVHEIKASVSSINDNYKKIIWLLITTIIMAISAIAQRIIL